MLLVDTGDTTECKHLDLLYIFNKITHFISDSLVVKYNENRAPDLSSFCCIFKSILLWNIPCLSSSPANYFVIFIISTTFIGKVNFFFHYKGISDWQVLSLNAFVFKATGRILFIKVYEPYAANQ